METPTWALNCWSVKKVSVRIKRRQTCDIVLHLQVQRKLLMFLLLMITGGRSCPPPSIFLTQLSAGGTLTWAWGSSLEGALWYCAVSVDDPDVETLLGFNSFNTCLNFLLTSAHSWISAHWDDVDECLSRSADAPVWNHNVNKDEKSNKPDLFVSAAFIFAANVASLCWGYRQGKQLHKESRW